jgi:hypothetical protein
LLRYYLVAATALSRCRHCLAAAKLLPTSRCRADTTAAAAAAAPPFVVVIVSPHQTAAI